MAKKLKTYILLGLCVALSSCSNSCRRVFYAFLDQAQRNLIVGTSNGAYRLTPSPVFLQGGQGGQFTQFLEIPQFVNPVLHPVLPSYYQPGLIGVSQWGITRWGPNSAIPTDYQLSSTPQNAVYDPSQYVLYTSHPSEGEIQKFDLHTNSVVKFVQLGPTFHPSLMSSPPDCSYISVLDIVNKLIEIFSPRTDTVTHTITLPTTPSFLSQTPDSHQIWTGDTPNNAIYTWEPMTGMRIGKITLVPSPNSVLFTKDGGDAYITSSAPPYALYFVSTETYKLDTMLKLDEKPLGLTQDPHGSNLWIQNSSGTITVVDPLSYSVIGKTAQVPGTPLSLFSTSVALKF